MIDRNGMIEAASQLGPVLRAAERTKRSPEDVATQIVDSLDLDGIRQAADLHDQSRKKQCGRDEEYAFRIAKAVCVGAKEIT